MSDVERTRDEVDLLIAAEDTPDGDEPDLTEPAAWAAYDCTLLPDGTIHVACQTNDDRDLGYPSGESWYTLTHASLTAARRARGVCRVGVSGIIVTVTLDGQRVEQPEDWDRIAHQDAPGEGGKRGAP